MVKTRLITIRRTVEMEVPDKDGKVKVQKVQKNFPCRINSAVPFDHRMCEHG